MKTPNWIYLDLEAQHAAEECCNDVLAMRRLHAHALEQGQVRFRNKFEKLQTAPANWSTRRAVRWLGKHHSP